MKVTLNKDPNFDKAIEVIYTMKDDEILDRAKVIASLIQANLKSMADKISAMTNNEYEDFIVNQCGE